MMKAIIYTVAIICSLLLTSCNSEPSLQKYFVEKTENKNFISLDLSPSILNVNKQNLSAEQNKALQSFERMNVLAFKLNDSNKAEYDTEKTKLKAILKDEKYQELMKFSRGSDAASVSFIGDENHIDEFILFANQKENGFAVVRILGKDMNPTGIVSMLSVLKESNIDMAQLKPLQDMMTKPKP